METPNYETVTNETVPNETVPRSYAEEFNTEPHLVAPKPDSIVCRSETGQCSCAKRRATALETCNINKPCDEHICSEPKLVEVETKKEKSANDGVCYPVPPIPAENTRFSPSTILVTEQEDKLYISVDTHTDNTVVESKSIQTFKDEQSCCCSTQTVAATVESSLDGKPIPPIIKPVGSSSKKRTYSILTGQRKTEEDAVVDKEAAKLNVGKYKSTKCSKREPIINLIGKPSSSAGSPLTEVTKKK